jgi:hypothetical protein
VSWLASFAIRYWLQLTIAGLLLGGATYWSVHERHIQRDKDAEVVAGLNATIAKDQIAIDDWVKAGKAWDTAVAAQKAAQDAQAARAATLLVQAKQAAAAHDKALVANLSRYHAAKPVTCAKETLPDGVLNEP